MTNPYYYLFYIIARFFKTIERRHNDALSSSSTIISLCFLFNFLALWVLLNHYKSFKLTTTRVILAAIPIFFINYFFLTKNDKGERLFNDYDRKFAASRHRKAIIALAILYVVFSVASAVCLGIAFGAKFHISN